MGDSDPCGLQPDVASVARAAAAKLLLAALAISLLLTSKLGTGPPPPGGGCAWATDPRLLLRCAGCSHSVVCNLPLALAAVIAVRWLLLRTEERCRAQAARRHLRDTVDAVPGVPPAALASQPPPPGPSRNWRGLVQSPVVEHAWETLCGSIVQGAVGCWPAGTTGPGRSNKVHWAVISSPAPQSSFMTRGIPI